MNPQPPKPAPSAAPADPPRPGIHVRQGAYLPHWTAESATYSVTFRLGDSLPESVLARWRGERAELLRRMHESGRELTEQELARLDDLHSERVERYLDAGHGACHMRDARIAELVQNALLFFDGQRYELLAWCVMPNHVHSVFRPAAGHSLSEIMHSWKGFTGTRANQILCRKGVFWQAESFDHLVRDQIDLERTIAYVLDNPRKAGLGNWRWMGVRAAAIRR